MRRTVSEASSDWIGVAFTHQEECTSLAQHVPLGLKVVEEQDLFIC